MKKGRFLSFSALAVLGATAYAVNYLIQNDKFSNDTKETLKNVITSAKDVGSDIKRTYTSIVNKDDIDYSKKSLGNSAKKLYDDSITLVKDASDDVITFVKKQISKNDEKEDIKPKKETKVIKKSNTTKTNNKKTTKNNKSTAKKTKK